MFFDLNLPIPAQALSKKGKGKQVAVPTYSQAQISAFESRLDLLIHLGYTVFALNQTIAKKFEGKTHVNAIDPLLTQLRKRDDVMFLKRLTIVLDEDSEKGFGLTSANAQALGAYDILSLTPTNAATLSLACLNHSLPSPLTCHIISLPLTLPRLPYHLKHTLIRTAIKNGAVFEITYNGALGGDVGELSEMGAGEGGTANSRRSWWTAAREVVRATKGKGIIVSGGVLTDNCLRAPRDVGNILTLLGLAQDAAHNASSVIAKSLILRAQTRKTYRAILSEPMLVVPNAEPTLEQSSALPEDAASKKRPCDEPPQVPAAGNNTEQKKQKKKRKTAANI